MKQPSDGDRGPWPPERGRWSSRRKTEVVLRVLRGEDLDALSRELGVTAGAIARWRDQFLAGGQAAVRRRPADARDEEITRLRTKVGEITMANELLQERARRAEAGRPFAPRRPKP
jgi:transposase-like protein